MAFSFSAFSYIIALIIDAFLIFFSIFHVIAFDELKTDYKNPIDQCDTLNPLVLPEYLLHFFINLLFLLAGEWTTLLINVPLIIYHIHRLEDFQPPEQAGFRKGVITMDHIHTLRQIIQKSEEYNLPLCAAYVCWSPFSDAKLTIGLYVERYFVRFWWHHRHTYFCLITVVLSTAMFGSGRGVPAQSPGIAMHLWSNSLIYRTRPVMSRQGLYDPTTIMNADVLTVCQREGWIKLAFYLLSFFLYLYGMIVVLIAA